MTATISAREPVSCAVSEAPGRSKQREAEEWQLVSAASHELRTPLTALRAEVELALIGDRDASELRAALRSAADEIRRVCRLADDILMLARSDHGRLPVRLRPLEPRVLLDAAAARAQAAARTRGRQIVVRDMAPGSWLLGDPDRAAQALDNLVSNALQYGSGTITLTARDDGELLGLHVADQGSGFAEDMAARAFQRFTRGQRAGDPGSGLGLSLVAAIAISHRGVATVCNLPEGGADACIALPRWFPETHQEWQPKWPGAAPTIETAGPRTGGCQGSDRRSAAMPSGHCSHQTLDRELLRPADDAGLTCLIEAQHPEWEEVLRSDQEMTAGAQSLNPQLRIATHQMIADQVLASESPEAWQTLQRLAALGYEWRYIMHMIAAVMSGDVSRQQGRLLSPGRHALPPP